MSAARSPQMPLVAIRMVSPAFKNVTYADNLENLVFDIIALVLYYFIMLQSEIRKFEKNLHCNCQTRRKNWIKIFKTFAKNIEFSTDWIGFRK